MDNLAEYKKFPTSLAQQQRARIQVLFGLTTADEYIAQVSKEGQLRDYLLGHIHTQAEKKVNNSSLKYDYSRKN